MQTKIILVGAVAIVLGSIALSLVVIDRETALPPTNARQNRSIDQTRPTETPVVQQEAPTLAPPEQIAQSQAGGPVNARTQAVAAASWSHPMKPVLNDPAAKEQLGRFALRFVGDDADADEVWMSIINDPSLPEEARKNLIEDLNEDGLSDPSNPTVDDLPLIESRLALIEDLAPDAIDDVNFDAFVEAYKDLLNMWNRLSRQ